MLNAWTDAGSAEAFDIKVAAFTTLHLDAPASKLTLRSAVERILVANYNKYAMVSGMVRFP